MRRVRDGLLVMAVALGAAGESAAWAQDDEPLDPETLALLEALTATPTFSEPAAAPWPSFGPFTRGVDAARLRETLSPDLEAAYELLPTTQGSLRGRLGFRRYLDDVRVDAGRSLDRMDPWLFQRVLVRRSPTAGQGPGSWRSDVVMEAFQGSPQLRGEVWLRGRSADRGAGALARVGGQTGPVRLSVAARGAYADTPSVRTSSGTENNPLGIQSRLGVSTRARVWGERDEPFQLDFGYDYDRAALLSGEDLEDIHIAQASLRYRAGYFGARLTGGYVDAVGPARLQGTLAFQWAPVVPPRLEYEDGASGAADGVGGQVRKVPQPQPVVEVGAFAEQPIEGDDARVEGYASVSQTLGTLQIDLSGRIWAAFGNAAERVPTGNVYLDLDARVAWSVSRSFALWARYARSHGDVGADARVEIVDLVEAGPHLTGRYGWLTLSGWGARVVGGAFPGLGRVPESTLGGFSAEGALVIDRWVLSGVVNRDVVSLDVPALGGGTVAPNTRGRLAFRINLPEAGGFAEVGMRTAVESPGEGPSVLLRGAIAPPYLVLDLRAGAELGAGFGLNVAASNLLDTPFTPVGRAEAASGVDVRAALSFAPGGATR